MTDSNRFQLLIDWLEANRISHSQAVSSLARFFQWKGVWDADREDLASEVLWRTAEHLEQERLVGQGWAALLGIAKNVFREWYRKQRHSTVPELPDSPDRSPLPDEALSTKEMYWAVEECTRCALGREEREILLRYRGETESGRVALAKELGIQLNALRVRVHTSEGRILACVHCVNRLTFEERTLLMNGSKARRRFLAEGPLRTNHEIEALRERLHQCSRKMLTYHLVIEPDASAKENSYSFPAVVKRLKLHFAIPSLDRHALYRVVVVSPSDVTTERTGLKATVVGSRLGIAIHLTTGHVCCGLFRASVYVEEGSCIEIARYRFELSPRAEKKFAKSF
jgi:DNA-directed RNA polymerase specialized sigma24 family protein